MNVADLLGSVPYPESCKKNIYNILKDPWLHLYYTCKTDCIISALQEVKVNFLYGHPSSMVWIFVDIWIALLLFIDRRYEF